MKVGMFGPYPPPRGGVSVHIQRLSDFLSNRGVNVEIFDARMLKNHDSRVAGKIRRVLFILRIALFMKLDLVHIHGGTWWESLLIVLASRLGRTKVVMTFHSLRQDFNQLSSLKTMAWIFMLKHSDYLISVGVNEHRKLKENFSFKTPFVVIPAFIPPKHTNISLPVELETFINKHKFIISANGSNLDFYCGEDLYGLDMLVELCGELSSKVDVAFVYCLSRCSDGAYMERILTRIQELGIENSFYISTESIDFCSVLQKSQVFIRPTCSDSYGVSIAEALTYGIPSIASDVCERPEGTVLFRSRSSEDLNYKVALILGDYDKYQTLVQNLKFHNHGHDILKVYEELMNIM